MNQRDVLAQLALEGSVQWLLFKVSSKIDQSEFKWTLSLGLLTSASPSGISSVVVCPDGLGNT